MSKAFSFLLYLLTGELLILLLAYIYTGTFHVDLWPQETRNTVIVISMI